MELKDFKVSVTDRTCATGATKANGTSPFLWASGTYNPFYNNNRVLLDRYEDRILVGKGLICLANEMKLKFDYILGTSMAGIGPASTMAELTGKPLLINHEGKFYLFEKSLFERKLDDAKDFFNLATLNVDTIATTIPFAIPHGVWLANQKKKRFMFVRSKPKDHGLNKQVEGNPKEGDTAMFMNYFMTKDVEYLSEAESGMSSIRVFIKHTLSQLVSEDKSIKSTDVSGERVLVVEDLVSTGGSSFKEVKALRDSGAHVDALISIFSYGLPAEKIFEENDCMFKSLLTFKEFLPIAVKGGYITNEEEKILNEWWPNQQNWGIKNGFLPVKKS